MNNELNSAKSIVADQVRGEWDAIKNYQKAIDDLNNTNGDFDDVIDVLNSISDEEEVHVGELQQAQASLDDNVLDNISDGESEAEEMIDDESQESMPDEELEEEIHTPSIDDIDSFLDDVYVMRQNSLNEEGEYGIGNLVFKELRNRGYIDKLKELKDELVGKELSLESLENTVDIDLTDNRQPIQDRQDEIFDEPYDYKKEMTQVHCLNEDSVADVDENNIEQEVYKGITIEHFPYTLTSGDKSTYIDGYIIKSPYYLQNSKGLKTYMPLYPEDENGEEVDFKSLDSAKEYIDKYIVTKKGKIKIKHGDEIHYELIPELIENITEGAMTENDTYYVTLYVEDSTSGPEEGGWVAYGMQAVKSIKCDNYEEALKVAQEYDDGDQVKYKGDDFTRYVDSNGEEYIISIEKPEDRGHLHDPAKTWDESEFGYESPKPKFDSNGKVIRENITEGAITGSKRDFSYNELAKFEKELYDKLKENHLYPEDGTFNNGYLTDLELVLVVDGDWKHDHLFTEEIVEEFCNEHNWVIVKHSSQEIGESDSDSYRAEHTWDIEIDEDGKTKETIQSFKRMFAKEDLEERLDDRLRRKYREEISRITFNQAIIQDNGLFNIYNVKENDVDRIINQLRNLDYIEYVNKVASRFDFTKPAMFGQIQPRYYTINGKINC